MSTSLHAAAASGQATLVPAKPAWVAPTCSDAAGRSADTFRLPGRMTAGVSRLGPAVRNALFSAAAWLSRPRRVLMLVATITVLNGFDLGFTLTAQRCAYFQELNPLAARLVAGPPILLALYKLSLVIPCAVILLWLRSQRVSELAAWLGVAAYSGVLLRWLTYYAHISQTLLDPTVPPETAMLASAFP